MSDDRAIHNSDSGDYDRATGGRPLEAPQSDWQPSSNREDNVEQKGDNDDMSACLIHSITPTVKPFRNTERACFNASSFAAFLVRPSPLTWTVILPLSGCPIITMTAVNAQIVNGFFVMPI